MENYNYGKPLDIACFFNDAFVKGFCNMLILESEVVYNESKITPIIENAEYGTLQIDYGFAIYCFGEYIKRYLASNLEEEKGVKIRNYILNDFLGGDNLAKNARFFIAVLGYYKLSYLPKSKNFYTRMIFKNRVTGVYFFINSIPITISYFNEITDMNITEVDYVKREKYELVAFDKQIISFLSKREETIKLYRFWDKEEGLSKILYK